MTTNPQQHQQADEIIRNHAWFSTVPGFAPVPILDLIGISAVQVDMIKQLCKVYDKEYNEQKGKAVVLSLAGSLLGRIPGYALRSVLKAVPGLGWALSGVSMSALAAASTYAVGEVFKEHFDQGGTLHDLNPESFREFYEKEVEKANKLVEGFWGKEEKGEDRGGEDKK